MSLDHRKIQARLAWDAACETLRNAIDPPHGTPGATDFARWQAFRRARLDFNDLCRAFDIALDAPETPDPVAAAPAPALRIVAIGAAEGGLEAISQLVASLPADFGAAVLIAFHTPPQGLAALTRVMDGYSALPIAYVEEGDLPKRGRVYLAPPRAELVVRPDGGLGLEAAPAPTLEGPAPRRAIDRLFESAALACGSRTIGVVLSGHDGDGTAGLDAIERVDGIGIVQDPDDARVADLPLHALEKDRPHYVARVGEMAALLVTLVR